MFTPTYNQFGYPMGGQPNPMGMYGQPQVTQPNQQAQTIQTIEQKPLQAVCYFVNSADDFKVDVLPGVYYLGINKNNKEMYIRKINDDGNVGLETYKLAVETKEKSELQQINDRLSNIEKYLNGLKGNKNDTRTNNASSPNHN